MASSSGGNGDIPVKSLTLGLRDQDLAVIGSFCKASEAAFGNLHKRIIQDTSSSKSRKAESTRRESRYIQYSEHKIQQYHAALKLVKNHSQECVAKNHSLGFIRQTLKLVLDHLKRNVKQVLTSLQQLQVAGMTNADVQKQTDQLLTLMTDTIMELKTILTKIPTSTERRERRGSVTSITSDRFDSGTSLEPEINENQRHLLKVWGTLDQRALIVEGILNGEIQLLLEYLSQRFDPEIADWMNVINTGLNETLIFLQEKEMGYAKKMIKNMGFDPNTKLRQMCLYTLDKNLRDYLTNELETQEVLSQEEIEMIDFIHQLEELYPCSSYEKAKELQSAAPVNSANDVCDLRTLLSGGNIQIANYCGELTLHHGNDKIVESPFYSHTMLEWLRSFDEVTRQRILLARAIELEDVADSIKAKIPTRVIWNYLCLHQDFQRLQKWIQYQYPMPLTGNNDECASPQVISWPYNLALSADVIEDLSGTTKYTRERVLNELARRGQFSSSEGSHFEALAKRLSNVHAVFQMPHVLENQQDDTRIGLSEFHRRMIQFCLEKELPQLLYFYLDYLNMAIDFSSIEDIQRGGEVPSWVNMMISFRQAAQSVLDPDTVFQASLSCSRHIQQLNNASIEAQIDNGFIFTALGTMMFSNRAFKEFAENPPEKAKQILRMINCPTLCEVLAEDGQFEEEHKFTTVYQLLHGNIIFDPRSLFGWQSANTLSSEDAIKQLPYFSQPQLVEQYGYKETLKWTYYLKQGRPSFAFCRLLVDEGLTAHSSELSPNFLRKICLKIHWLGIKYFHQNHVTAACTVVMEMLGADSTVFRIHIQAANQIADHICSDLKGSLEERKQLKTTINKEIANEFHNCMQNRESSVKNVYLLLEEAIDSTFKHHPHLSRTDSAAEYKWLILHAFCKCHQLPFTSKFLEYCAEKDDWLTFLTYAQVYQYPIEQIQTLSKKFPNEILREHLDNIMNVMFKKNKEESSRKDDRTKFEAKDFRMKLYATVGVSKDQSSTDDEGTADVNGLGPYALDSEFAREKQLAESSVESMAPISSECDNLLDLVRECEKSMQPAKLLCKHATRTRNPVLAIIAACFEDHDVMTCMSSWLYASLPFSAMKPGHDDFASSNNQRLLSTLQDLHNLWQLALETQSTHLLHTAFKIFSSTSLILPFLDFISSLLRHCDDDHLKSALAEFIESWKKIKSDMGAPDFVMFPKLWLEEQILATIKFILCERSQVSTLLKLLDQSNFIAELKTSIKSVPNIKLLHQLTLLVKEDQIDINFQMLLDENKPQFQEEWLRIISCLEAKESWNKAKVARETLNHPTIEVTINQLNAELKGLKSSVIWPCEDVQVEFWMNAEKSLTEHESGHVVAARFFKEHAEQSIYPKEQEFLYELAYKWLSKSTEVADGKERESLFTHIWKSKIHAHLQNSSQLQHNSSFETRAKSSGLRIRFDKSQLRKLRPTALPEKDPVELASEEKSGLEILLNDMLEAGQILEAMKIATHFGHSNQDLNIILTCHRLANGDITPDGLDVVSRRLIEGPQRLRRRQSSLQMVTLPRIGSSLSIASRLSETGDVLMNDDDACVSCINLLAQQCNHGKQGCQLILCIYQIAKLLGIEYKEALAIDEFKLLGHVVSSELPTRYLLAKSFIQSAALVDSQVAGFLCDMVVDALEMQLGITGSKSTSGSAGVGGKSSLSKKLVINELVQLCKDPAVLGQRLLQSTLTSKSSNVHPSVQTLELEVELLIYAHDCFTLACHMEGISELLRVCRSVAQRLHESEQYSSMVTLLTGVGRYSEMTYIFDILKNQHQFELLFRKRTDKENKLKLAILDYLERYHKDDKDTYEMVALHFTMYRQIASMLHKSAQDHMRQMKHVTLDNSSESQKKLREILNYLSDAAESYIKEGCVRQAEECVRQAKLVALQIQLLPSKVRVINLEEAGLMALLPHFMKMLHVHIVLEAYGENRLWGIVYLHHLVKKGDFKMKKELGMYQKITPALISDVAERFESQQSSASKQQLANMQKLLGFCKDIKLAQNISQRLGLVDFSHQLTKGAGGAYLKDAKLK